MLAILTTHPIQYQVPLWQALAADGRVPFEVWYMTDHAIGASRDREFDATFAWDIDMLSGYPYRFIEMADGSAPGSFWKTRLRESLRTRLREADATALWIQGWQVAAYWQAVQEANAAGIEVWLRGESNDLAPTTLSKRIVKWIALRWLFTRVNRFLYIGSANKRLYQNYGVPEERLSAAPYAVDNKRFAAQAEALYPNRMELRRAWGIPDDAFCVSFCGKFISKKRPRDLISAAKLLIASGHLPNTFLLFAGSGPLGAELRRECQVVFDVEKPVNADNSGQKERPRASFVGFLNQTQISQAYVASDCLALPSDQGETWGLVVNEAMASGLPCVVSNACGCNEDLIQPVDPECSFRCGDPQNLASALLHAYHRLSDPAKWAANIAEQDYRRTIETIVELMHVKSRATTRFMPSPHRS